MSRHRNIRNLSLEDELSEDIYGRSFEDNDYCVSPATEAEFMFHRDKRHTLSSFIESNKKIDEEPDIEDEEEQPVAREEDYRRPVLDPMQQAKLQMCVEKVEDVVGDAFHEKEIIDAIIANNYNCDIAINQLLNKGTVSSLGSCP